MLLQRIHTSTGLVWSSPLRGLLPRWVFAMSMKWVALTVDHGPEDAGLYRLFVALADRADENGLCWPSREDLKRRSRMSDTSITRALRRLEAEGWLQRERRFNSSNLFRLNVFRLMERDAAARAAPVVPKGFEPFPEETRARAKAKAEGAQAIENKGSGHIGHTYGHRGHGSGHFGATNLSRTCQEPSRAKATAEPSRAPVDAERFNAYRLTAKPGERFKDWAARTAQ